jgi:asparagine synthetase B (glutamine-hydrolysing)
MTLPGEVGSRTISERSVAFGVARRWESQEVAAVPGVQIAIDADLYNVAELRSKVAGRVAGSHERTVAECLAYLYGMHGPNFLEHVHGIFSLALWDERHSGSF